MFRSMGAIFVLLGMLGGLMAQGADKDVQAILDKAIKAHASEKAAKAKLHTWKVKGTINLGGMEQAYTADYFFQAPSKFRFDLAMNFGGMEIELTAATDGKATWEKMGPMMREMDKKKAEEFRHNVYTMYLSLFLPMKDKSYKLTALGESKVGDKPVVGIRIEHKDQREVRLYFDKTTGLLAKSESKVHDEFADKDVTQEALFTDYTDKDGMKVFGKLTLRREGKDFVVEKITEQKELKKVDPKLFAKPKEEQ